MTIPYTLLPSIYKGSVRLPLAKIILNYKKTHKITPVPISALIDSGADVCFCNETIGAWLGIKFKKNREGTFTTANKTTFQEKLDKIVKKNKSFNKTIIEATADLVCSYKLNTAFYESIGHVQP